MIVPGLFFINPVLALIILTLLTVGAVGESIGSRPGRPHRPYQAPHTLDESYLAVGREPPAPRRKPSPREQQVLGRLVIWLIVTISCAAFAFPIAAAYPGALIIILPVFVIGLVIGLARKRLAGEIVR